MLEGSLNVNYCLENHLIKPFYGKIKWVFVPTPTPSPPPPKNKLKNKCINKNEIKKRNN